MRRRRRRRLQSMAVLPTMFTLGNLVCGFAAIHYTSQSLDEQMPWGWSTITFAGVLIFLGMFFDAIDGSVARLTGAASEFGAQLDSLADIVTFGVAPAYLVLRIVSAYLQVDADSSATLDQFAVSGAVIGPHVDDTFAKFVWAVAIGYVCCAALRLARFNVESKSLNVADHMVFRGLPSPGAAGALASLIMLHQHWLYERYQQDAPAMFDRVSALGMTFVMLLCAVGMVSSIPYIHLFNRYLRRKASFGYVVRILVVIVCAMFLFQETLAVAFTAYALHGPMRIVLQKFRAYRQPSAAS